MFTPLPQFPGKRRSCSPTAGSAGLVATPSRGEVGVVGCSKGQEKEVSRGESRDKPGPTGVTGNDFSQPQGFPLSGGFWGSGEKLLWGEKPQKEGLTSWCCQVSLRLRSPLREGGQDGQ